MTAMTRAIQKTPSTVMTAIQSSSPRGILESDQECMRDEDEDMEMRNPQVESLQDWIAMAAMPKPIPARHTLNQTMNV